MRRAISATLLLLAGIARAQTVATVYVTAPQVRVTSADSEQLSAIGRDGAGNPVSASATWSSNNTSVVSVDSNGVATAGALGIADITATINGRQGILRLQVLPQRIEVTPANVAINFGAQQQFTAIAYDSQNQPIPSATFAWHVLVAGGAFDSSTVSIPGGLVTAKTLGYYIVRASVVYNQGADQFEREFDGSTTFQIVPADYKVTSLASSRLAFPSFHLRGKRTLIAANDAGQVVFTGSLDGLTTAILSWQSPAGINALATAGSAGVMQGTVFYDFDNVSIDSSGNLLATAYMTGASTNVVLANAQGFQTVVPDRSAADLVLDVTNMTTNRYSLSETGDIVVRGNFHYDGSTVNYNGLLRYSGVQLILEASSMDPLPGLTGQVSFDDQYGLDGNGVLYFSANAGSGRAVFRKEPFKDPVKVIALGDLIGGVAVTQLRQLAVAPAGDLVLSATLTDGSQILLHYVGGVTGAAPVVMNSQPGYINQLYAFSPTGGIVWLGDNGSGYGLNLWDGASSTSRLVLSRFSPSPTGEPVADFYSAAVDAAGNVYANVRGVDTAWMLIKISSSPFLIASDGTLVNTSANLDLSPQLVFGDRTGPLHVLAGGNQPSIFQAGGQGLLPFLVAGDRLPGGSTYIGNYTSRKAPSGDVYITTDNGTYRTSQSGASSLISSFPLSLADGVLFNSPYNIAVNDHNQLLMIAGTDHSHQRLIFNDGTTTKTLAYFQGSPPYQTPSPAGGTFANVNDMAINDSGQAMVNFSANGGPSGLFFYDGTAWQTVCSLDKCKFDGESITNIGSMRVSGNKFCAVFSTPANQRLDCWENGTWTNILKRGDIASDGTDITFVYNTFDINRVGDVAVILNTNLGGPGAFLNANGYFTILSAVFPPADATAVIGMYSIDLRDDRRVFMITQTDAGLIEAYEADPQF